MSRMLLKLLFAASIIAVAPSMAQTKLDGRDPDELQYLSNSAIEQMLMTTERGRVYSGHTVNSHESYWVEFMKRLDHGNLIENHAHWVDYITILSGEGSVTYGGDVSGATSIGPGEMRGGTMTGGTVQALKTGDYILIPAGVPHIINATSGQQLKYVIFKHRV